MKKILVVLSLFLISVSGLVASEGHKISVKIAGLNEGPVILAYHFGDRQFIQDTAKVMGPENFVFEGQNRLIPGIYLVVLPGQEFFEIIIDQNQHFEIRTRTGALQAETQFDGSPENEAFFAYMQYIAGASSILNSLNQELSAEGLTEEARSSISERIEMINREVRVRQDAYISQFPTCLFSLVLRTQRDPQLPPEHIRNVEGAIDQVAMYNLFKSQFWTNMDFADQRLLRTPVYHNRLNRYFSSVVMQKPDSLIAAADRLLARARPHREMFRYALWFITSHFERSQIMGHDKVFVHMVDNYYLTGQADWVSPQTIGHLRQVVEEMRPLLIGRTAPDIHMFLPDGQRKALHQMQSRFTIVYFWDSECIHCVRVTPQLRDMVKQFAPDQVQVFAVNIEADRQLWLNAVEKYQIGHWVNVNDTENVSGFMDTYNLTAVPTIYLLDHEKRIIAKMITVDQIQQIINMQL